MKTSLMHTQEHVHWPQLYCSPEDIFYWNQIVFLITCPYFLNQRQHTIPLLLFIACVWREETYHFKFLILYNSWVLVNPYPKLTDLEKKHVMNYFDSSSQDQCIETNTKRILTHVLMRCNEDNSIAHPSTCALTPAETVSLKIYSIKLK